MCQKLDAGCVPPPSAPSQQLAVSSRCAPLCRAGRIRQRPMPAPAQVTNSLARTDVNAASNIGKVMSSVLKTSSSILIILILTSSPRTITITITIANTCAQRGCLVVQGEGQRVAPTDGDANNGRHGLLLLRERHVLRGVGPATWHHEGRMMPWQTYLSVPTCPEALCYLWQAQHVGEGNT